MQKCFESNIEFRNQFIVSAIKFGESLSKFMISIALLEKFGILTFIMSSEISHMTRHSSKPN